MIANANAQLTFIANDCEDQQKAKTNPTTACPHPEIENPDLKYAL